jgi:hypothetical protein
VTGVSAAPQNVHVIPELIAIPHFGQVFISPPRNQAILLRICHPSASPRPAPAARRLPTSQPQRASSAVPVRRPGPQGRRAHDQSYSGT